MKGFLNRMLNKYGKYLQVINTKEENTFDDNIESIKNSTDEIIEDFASNKDSLSNKEIELAFPEHIKSYYGSSEF